MIWECVLSCIGDRIPAESIYVFTFVIAPKRICADFHELRINLGRVGTISSSVFVVRLVSKNFSKPYELVWTFNYFLLKVSQLGFHQLGGGRKIIWRSNFVRPRDASVMFFQKIEIPHPHRPHPQL